VIDFQGKKTRVTVRGTSGNAIYDVKVEDPGSDEWIDAPAGLKDALMSDEAAMKAIKKELDRIHGKEDDLEVSEHPTEERPSKDMEDLEETQRPGKMPEKEHEEEMAGTSWIDRNETGFRLGEPVWRRDMVGSLEYAGDEPGRVIAIGSGQGLVD